ncbi:cation diffusion facilitator family transporter [Oryzomicrobium terrae]|uniref:Cation diffusion facilitator family transporter n=1 Tax=Oryzomicrobium terrae TaxID=1735038 RepID=A0A5C1E3S1_9RHOO|nr:CDF family Co(II)/Ni(II) efflux transporter DmeF [Oryzomicrobium terrae]QEL63510.1 cation diffusion facilitator family transporter [Oryzomicrobium terrae]
MAPPPIAPGCAHSHAFFVEAGAAERRTRWVTLLTLVTMVVEIAAGYLSQSMALLADGWHMGTHAFALGLAALAYALARRHRDNPRFAFGTWKIEVLGGYTSALFLLVVAATMVWESVERLRTPLPVSYGEALVVAVVGLLVNLGSAWLLHGGGHDHGHAHHDHDHHHAGHDHHHDLNLRAAYLHVVADAATSVLAIVALLGGLMFGWSWLDPLMGLVGSAIITVWAIGLVRDTGRVLLDAEMDAPVVAEILDDIRRENEHPAELTDLHVWRVGRGRYAAIVALTTASRAGPDYYRHRLGRHSELAHITVEVTHRTA